MSSLSNFVQSTPGKLTIAVIVGGGVILLVSYSPLGKLFGSAAKVTDFAIKGIKDSAKWGKKASKTIYKKALLPAYKEIKNLDKEDFKKVGKTIEKPFKKFGKSTKKGFKKFGKKFKKAFKI